VVISLDLRRNAGHPWDNRPGFDLLAVDASTRVELEAFAAQAAKKCWRPWLLGQHRVTGKPGGLLYKPCGASAPWHDSLGNPHPGNVQPTSGEDSS
jgi:hypothetical protein